MAFQVHVRFGTSSKFLDSGAGKMVLLQNVEPARHLDFSTCEIRNVCE